MMRRRDRCGFRPAMERVEARNLLNFSIFEIVGHTFTDLFDGPNSRHYHPRGPGPRQRAGLTPTPVPTPVAGNATVARDPSDLVPPLPGPRPLHLPGPHLWGRGRRPAPEIRASLAVPPTPATSPSGPFDRAGRMIPHPL